jgi:four helix bundle protein
MSIIGSYRDLDAWAVSMDLVDQVLRDVKRLPREEFELRSQIKRAAISIPSNVAEGWCRKDRRQAYRNHVSIALGSRGELDTELEICFRNGLLRREDGQDLIRQLDRARPLLVHLYESL